MSYYDNTPNYIIASAKGSTDTAFTSVTFKAVVITQGKTGPEAKEKAIPRIEAIKKIIAAHAKDAGIEADRLRTSFDVDVYRNRHTSDFEGYQATYTCTFKGTNVAHATALHDALTSIEGIQAPSPVFNLDNSPEVHAAAFKDAADKARKKFSDECQALSRHPGEFHVASWRIEEERYAGGKTLSLGGGAEIEGKTITIAPGKARQEVEVILVFVRTKPEP